MSDLIPFSFEEHPVRVITIDGEPWFVGKDVAQTLGYTNPSKAMTDHCRGVTKRYPLRTPGGIQESRVLSEPDVLRLIVGSKLPAAERFERWVFEEVLPAIRKTGGYMVAAPEETPEQLALRAMAVLQAAVDRQKAQLAEAQPKVEVHDRIIEADGSLTVTEAAKALQVKPKALFAFLAGHRWIYKRPGSAHWLGYQAHTANGDLEHKVGAVRWAYGERR